MRHVRLEIADDVYQQATQRALNEGFASLDEYLADAISELATEEIGPDREIIHRVFTSEAIAELDRVRSAIQEGGKTYSPEQVDEHFRQKSQAWREARGD